MYNLKRAKQAEEDARKAHRKVARKAAKKAETAEAATPKATAPKAAGAPVSILKQKTALKLTTAQKIMYIITAIKSWTL